MVSSQTMKINAKLVDIGMYVCELDRPWKNTPFSIHGFYVRDLDEVKQLKIHCEYLFIDPTKGTVPEPVPLVPTAGVRAQAFDGKLVAIKPNAHAYSDVNPITKEMAIAIKAYEQLLVEISTTMTAALRGSLRVLKPLVEASNTVVDSFIRNPDAVIWLVRVRKTDDDPYFYLLRSACWAILLGRYLGLPKTDLRALSLGVLLKDIGSLSLPKVMQANLLANKCRSTIDADVQSIVVENTLSVLKKFTGLHPKVIKIIKMHGERLNGTGFPQKLAGDQIFLLAKIAGLANYYDEVTYKLEAKCAIPVSQSVSNLYRVRGILFQDDIVTAFIKAIGLYPTGTLVKLNTNEVAVVVEQNYERRLKPKILLVVDADGKAMDKLVIVDLYDNDRRHQAGLSRSKKAVTKMDIVEDIAPYKYPIKVTKIREEYIAMNTKKSFFSIFK